MSWPFEANYPGTCAECDGRIVPGQTIHFLRIGEVAHVRCPDLTEKPKGEPCPDCFLYHPAGACDR